MEAAAAKETPAAIASSYGNSTGDSSSPVEVASSTTNTTRSDRGSGNSSVDTKSEALAEPSVARGDASFTSWFFGKLKL